MRKLSSSEIEQELTKLTGWQLDKGKLFREFTFQDFLRAFGFMTGVALAAESMNHHPDWLNHYSKVKIWLNSHEVDGLSPLDFELAKKINELYSTK